MFHLIKRYFYYSFNDIGTDNICLIYHGGLRASNPCVYQWADYS